MPVATLPISTTVPVNASLFTARLLRPAAPGDDGSWAFVLLPEAASKALPRRGRTSIGGKLNGQAFQATLEPDGQLGHWLRIDSALRAAAGADFGDAVAIEMAPVKPEPEPALPEDLRQALDACPQAKAVWNATTTLAWVDWVHWVESAKQATTRQTRVAKACDMLVQGKKRVCCFDPSGCYSKSLSAPEAMP